ncbi:MAG: lysylphosphatidylglycerol synthase transmembrane domain-containing protein [Phototrophicaceae bacterium]
MYILLLVIFDFSGQFQDGEDMLAVMRSFPLWLVPVLCLTQISAGFFRFLEWHYYLGVIDARDRISLKDSAIIFVSAFTMVVSPGKVAEVLKSVFLKMKTGVTIARSAPVVVAERVVDGLAVVITVTVGLIIARSSLELGEYGDIARGIIFVAAFLLFGGLIAVQIKPLAYFILDKIVARLPLLRRLHLPLTEFYESSREVFLLRHVIPTTIMGLGVYFSSTAGFVLIMLGFGVSFSWELVLQIGFIVGVSSAVGALSFVPNGAGVTEITNFAMLQALVAPNHPEVTAGVAAAAALMQGFFHKWFRVLVGLGVAFVYRRRLFTSELETEIQQMEAERAARKEAQPALTVE